jgi:hypothetical protein
MSFFEDQEKRIAEEQKHVRNGGCIAIVLALILIPTACWFISTYTSGGTILGSHATILYNYYGLGPIVPGIPAVVEQACELDRTKPAGYQQRQSELSEQYKESSAQYRSSYQALVKLDQEVGFYPPPEDIPPDLNVAKIIFCYR